MVRCHRLTTAFVPGCYVVITGLYYVKQIYVHDYSVALRQFLISHDLIGLEEKLSDNTFVNGRT